MRTRILLRALLVSVAALGCTVDAGGGDGGGDGDAPSSDGGAGGPDSGPGPDAAVTYDVAACSEDPAGALALEFTYDAPPDTTGGTIELQGSETWSLTEPDGSGRLGARGVRSELRYGDEEAYGGPRAETAVVGGTESRYAAGDSFYYGFSVHVPAGWVDDGAVEDILFQWKNISDDGEPPKSPDIFLGIKRDEFVLRITSDANPISTTDSPLKEQEVLVDGLDYAAATWHDFVFRVVWAYEGDTGLIEAWHRTGGEPGYRKVLEKTGPNMHNDQLAGYLKWGIYKPAWRTGPTAPSVRVVMHDEIRAGGSFGAVEPGCVR